MEVPSDDGPTCTPEAGTKNSSQPESAAAAQPSASSDSSAPEIKGDVQGSQVSTYLRKRITEEQFDAFCIDCQNNRSSHCNVTFGTFICAECAEKHILHFSQFQSYIKPLFDGAWDNFQIACVKAGGNQRFFEYLREYAKERDPIAKKYDCAPAHFYRRRLCAQAMKTNFQEVPPAKSAKEQATQAMDKTGAFFTETNQKYEISKKTSEAAVAAKTGILSLWGRAKTLVAKNPNNAAAATGEQEGAQAASSSSPLEDSVKAPLNQEIVEEMKDPQNE